MISHISGKCIDKNEKNIILDVSGVGYMIFSTLDTINSIEKNETASLWTYLSVRENALELFGFKTKEELNFFELLISISGIGPKGAIGVMNMSNVDTLKEAIATQDITYLTKISGIGKKTAEKMILELKDKLGKEGLDNTNRYLGKDTDVLLALQSLGYGEREIREALKNLSNENTDTSEKIKEMLKILGNK